MKDRHRSPHSLGTQVARVAWAVCQATLFRCSPRPMFRWRVWLLNLFGATVHRSARIHPTVRIVFPWNLTVDANAAVGDAAILYALGSIQIGKRVTISQFAHLCAGTHDYRSMEMPLQSCPITLHDDVWIAADALVGPHVTAGEGAILGARGVTMKDLQPWTIYAGNPAEPRKPRPRFTDASHASSDVAIESGKPDASVDGEAT